MMEYQDTRIEYNQARGAKAEDPEGATALDLADLRGHSAVADLLRAEGAGASLQLLGNVS